MSIDFKLDAQVRDEKLQGKGASRRLRKQNRVPAIIYGGAEDPLAIAIPINQLTKSLESEAFFSHILTITVEGANEPEEVVIKDLQRHPAKGFPMHADFQRIVKGQKITMRVPIRFVDEDMAPGKKMGGIVNTIVTDIEINCIPSKIPEYLEISLSQVEMGESLHLSNIELPEGVEILELIGEDGTDRAIVSIQAPRQEKEKAEDVTDDEAQDEDGE